MANICGKYALHCKGIDPFGTLMGNFNWGPISRNDIISSFGPIPVRSGRFGPISGVSCFGPISKVGCFGLIYLFWENRKDIRLSSP